VAFTHKRVSGLWDRSTDTEKRDFLGQTDLLDPRNPARLSVQDALGLTGELFSRRLLLQQWSTFDKKRHELTQRSIEEFETLYALKMQGGSGLLCPGLPLSIVSF
jgi:hypothetical protein